MQDDMISRKVWVSILHSELHIWVVTGQNRPGIVSDLLLHSASSRAAVLTLPRIQKSFSQPAYPLLQFRSAPAQPSHLSIPLQSQPPMHRLYQGQ